MVLDVFRQKGVRHIRGVKYESSERLQAPMVHRACEPAIIDDLIPGLCR